VDGADSAASRIDLAQALDEGAWTVFQRVVLLFAALAFAVDGLANQVLGVAIPSLIHEWHAPRAAFASVAALGLVGVTVGTAAGGLIGDRFGRRVGLTASMLLFGAMTALAATAHSVPMFAGIRLLDGLGIGAAIPNGAALISEFTPLRRRSLALAFCMLFIPVGGLLAGLLAAVILPHMGCRMLFLVTGGATLAIALTFILVLPESPRFLLRWPHRRPELIKLLGRFGYGFSSDAEFIDSGVERFKTPLSALFGRTILRDTSALWIGFFFCLMASYTLFSWLPTLLSGQGLSVQTTSLSMTAFNGGGMVGGLIVGWLIHQFGSRGSVIGVAGAAALGAAGLAFFPFAHGGIGLIAVVLGVEGLLVSGLHTGLYTIAATAYPPFIRATGVGSAAAFGRVGAIASSFTGVISMEMGGGKAFFLFMGAALLASTIAIAFIKRQTPKAEGPAMSQPLPEPH
jgi:AAHS family 4-hydroxybenzoate transporter-like MFS transporter